MCNCIENVNKKLKEMYPDATNIYFENREILSGRLFSSVCINREGRKKPTIEKLLHSRCPMCGKLYDEGEAQ